LRELRELNKGLEGIEQLREFNEGIVGIE